MSAISTLSDFFGRTLFTAWGYDVTILETIASLVSFIAVALGITAKRITWPWWALSSVLYGAFFFQYELYASAALQIVFIIAAILGWRGWAPEGARPGSLSPKLRVVTITAICAATLALAPLLNNVGAASTYFDALLFFGSVAAQILMIYEKYETWILWLIVNVGYVTLYAQQELLFTTILYITLTLMAALGWSRWYATHRSAIRSL